MDLIRNPKILNTLEKKIGKAKENGKTVGTGVLAKGLLEGITKATGRDIAGEIIKYAVKRANRNKKNKK